MRSEREGGMGEEVRRRNERGRKEECEREGIVSGRSEIGEW